MNQLPQVLKHDNDGLRSMIMKEVAKKKILLVEDQPLISQLHKTWLEKLECHVDVAQNGQTALEFISNGNQYDLIFMDIDLPDMDGISITKIIRSNPLLTTPIIALTTHGHEIKAACFQSGMNDFLTKPTNQKILSFILNRWS